MAKVRLYQFYDRVAETVIGPIIATNRDAAAIRHFQEIMNHPESDPAKHPEDYELRYIGNQDQDSGTLAPETPTSIYSGHDWAASRARAASATGANGAPAAAAPLRLEAPANQ